MADTSPKVLLYLGAGASRFAGYCTFVDFPGLLFDQNRRQAEGMPPLSPNPQRILWAIKESLERNRKATTHDNFLWRLDGYRQLLLLNQSDDVLQDYLHGSTRLGDLHDCTTQAVDQISSTTVHHYSINRVDLAKTNGVEPYERMRRVLQLYYDLGQLNEQNPELSIFTTNYDLLIEDLVAEFGPASHVTTRLINGFLNQTQEGAKWDGRLYEKSRPSLRLYRLHGCVCWFSEYDRDSDIFFHRRDALEFGTNRLCAMYPGRQTEVGVRPHGYSFWQLYRALRSCELAVFIGFSFRDDDVMHVLMKAMAERRSRPRILIVDPLYTRNDVIHKLEEASRRCPFPYRVPKDNGEDIQSIQVKFGVDPQFDSEIIAACKRML